MQNFIATTADASSLFLKDWAVTYLTGGLAVALLGAIAGWLIWRGNRKVLNSVEEKSREARSNYEQINEELNRLKIEISDPQT